MKTAEISVVHALENRIRLHFNEPPVNAKSLVDHLGKLDGVGEVSYSEITRNILINYERKQIELLTILKEIVMGLSSQYCMRTVSVRVKDSFQFTNLSLVALAAIGVSYGARVLGLTPMDSMGMRSNKLEYGAGIVTGLAVLEHAAIEVNKSGIFDPEAFSVLYLFNQMKGKQPMKGAFFTWIAAFGRHLMPVVQTNRITFKVIEGVDYRSGEKYTDIITNGSISLLDHYNRNVSLSRKELIKGVIERYKHSQIVTGHKRKLHKRGGVA